MSPLAVVVAIVLVDLLGFSVVMPLLEDPITDRPNWTIPRLIAEIKRQERVTIAPSQLSKALRKNFRFRRPRHMLKGRQVACEVERVGLRLQLRKRQAAGGQQRRAPG